MEIEVLHRQGKGIRAIARETGVARNTIRAILRGQNDGRYGPRTPRPTKIGPFKSYLQERLDAAGKVRLPATVLLREIRAQGYEGGITQLKEYLREIRPARPAEPIVRFETEPGSQLQIDFVVLRRGALPLRAFTAELGYSRYSYVEFTDNERSATLIACLENALALLRRRSQPRALRQSQDDRYRTKRLRRRACTAIHAGWLDFVKHYGLGVKLCSPYRAQTKGKIERFHRYLRASFFNPLQTTQSDPSTLRCSIARCATG